MGLSCGEEPFCLIMLRFSRRAFNLSPQCIGTLDGLRVISGR